MINKFEVYVSFRSDRNGTEAFLASKKIIDVSANTLISAICLHEHKKGLRIEDATGYVITNDGIKVLFD